MVCRNLVPDKSGYWVFDDMTLQALFDPYFGTGGTVFLYFFKFHNSFTLAFSHAYKHTSIETYKRCALE